jgi:hypothetical protein
VLNGSEQTGHISGILRIRAIQGVNLGRDSVQILQSTCSSFQLLLIHMI